jgi:hypothetical protein
LRAAFEWALDRAGDAALARHAPPPRGAAPADAPVELPDDEPPAAIETLHLNWTSESATPWVLTHYELPFNSPPPIDPPDNEPPETIRLRSMPPSPREAPPEIAGERAQERALMIALESALQKGDAREASQLYFRAAATGALPLGGTERMLVRLFTVALEDMRFDGAAFRALATTLGWDQPRLESAASDVRQRVLTRLAAEDCYDNLVATAMRQNRRPRFEVRVACLILRRRGGVGLWRINRPTLRAYLDQLKPHQGWLRDRISAEWIAILENRLKRRGLIGHGLAALFIGGLLINCLVVAVVSLLSDGFTPGLAVFTLPLALLSWLLKVIVVSFVKVWRGGTA